MNDRGRPTLAVAKAAPRAPRKPQDKARPLLEFEQLKLFSTAEFDKPKK